jgi:hypothetical protein
MESSLTLCAVSETPCGMKYAMILVAAGGGATPIEANPTVLAVASAAPETYPLQVAINAAFGSTQPTTTAGANIGVQIIPAWVRVDGVPIVGGALSAESGVYTVNE